MGKRPRASASSRVPCPAGIIRTINEQGVTVLLVEQNVKQTLAIAHGGHVLSQVGMVAVGDPDQLSENPEVREV